MKIRHGGLPDIGVEALLREQIKDMQGLKPPLQAAALLPSEILADRLPFWTAWDDDQVVGCTALRPIEPRHYELKAMRTRRSYRQKGVASALLQTALDYALRHGIQRVSLVTGSDPYFEAARCLYEQHGFAYCSPWSAAPRLASLEYMSRQI